MHAGSWRETGPAMAMAVSLSLPQIIVPSSDCHSVIHRADYHRVLVEECERLGVDLKLGADVQDLHIETTKVTLRSGEMVSGDVIIGADGKYFFLSTTYSASNLLGLWSTLRSQILGHPSPPQATSDLAYRGTFSRSSLQALDNPAIDKLCENNGSNMWLGPKGHAVFYPLRCGTQFNLVITCPDDLPPHVSTMEGDIEEMKAVFEGWDPV
jgi:salicylate hydroxylase